MVSFYSFNMIYLNLSVFCCYCDSYFSKGLKKSSFNLLSLGSYVHSFLGFLSKLNLLDLQYRIIGWSYTSVFAELLILVSLCYECKANQLVWVGISSIVCFHKIPTHNMTLISLNCHDIQVDFGIDQVACFNYLIRNRLFVFELLKLFSQD